MNTPDGRGFLREPDGRDSEAGFREPKEEVMDQERKFLHETSGTGGMRDAGA